MEESSRLAPNQLKEDVVTEPYRKQSPLWQDSSFPAKRDYDVVLRRYPRSRKKSLVVGIIIFVLVASSIALGVIWQYQGINPLEILANLSVIS